MLFKIYTKPSCSYCVKAKELLKSLSIPYQEYVVGDHVTKEELEGMIGKPVTTVPVILNGFTYIGGYTDLMDYLIGEDLV